MPAQSDANDIDLPRIMQETWIDRVHYFESIDSTNSAALQHASAGLSDPAPNDSIELLTELFLADRQTAGRGRGSNAWWSSGGALTFSLLTQPVNIPARNLSQVSLVMGVAICKAMERFLPTGDIALKWPNDVYLNERKVAGILIELTSAPLKRLVVGVGMNVNNPLAEAPAELRTSAISMVEAQDGTAMPLDRTEILIACLEQMERELSRFSQGTADIADAWRKYSLLTGKHVEVSTPSRKTTGTCEGIADDGALLVRTQSGLQACHGGVVARFE